MAADDITAEVMKLLMGHGVQQPFSAAIGVIELIDRLRYERSVDDWFKNPPSQIAVNVVTLDKATNALVTARQFINVHPAVEGEWPVLINMLDKSIEQLRELLPPPRMVTN